MEQVKETNFTVKVNQLLENIRQLKDENVLDRIKIFRQFIILDWIFKWESSRRDLTEEETIELERTKRRVEVARIEANATMEDLQAMPIPVLEKKREGSRGPAQGKDSISYFPYYMQLPAWIVREKILGYLTDPQDKLNVIRACSSEGTLMNWDENTSSNLTSPLQQIFKFLLQQRVLDFEDVIQLGRVNRRTRDIATRALERGLLGFEHRRIHGLRSEWIYNYSVKLMQLPESFYPNEDEEGPLKLEQLSFNPIISQVYLIIDDEYHFRFGFDREMAMLRKYGHRVWYFKIAVYTWAPMLDQIQLVASCLHLMPNLRKLTIHRVNRHEEEDTEKVLLIIEGLQLPELRFLKALSIYDSTLHPVFSLLAKKLLEKQSKRLEHLKIGTNILVLPGDNYRLFAPHLTSLLIRNKLSLDMCLEYLSIFRESALTEISVEDLEKYAARSLPSLISHISKYFGETLEKLFVDPWREMDHNEVILPSSLPSTWMTELTFPKMKRLFVGQFDDDGDIDQNYILLFPALESFSLNMRIHAWNHLGRGEFLFTTRRGEEFLSNRRLEEFRLARRRREFMSGSILWKLLPNLDRYNLFSSGRLSMMTRKDCI